MTFRIGPVMLLGVALGGCSPDGRPTTLSQVSQGRLWFHVHSESAREELRQQHLISVMFDFPEVGQRLRGDCPTFDVTARFGDVVLRPIFHGGQIHCEIDDAGDCGACTPLAWAGDISELVAAAPAETTLVLEDAGGTATMTAELLFPQVDVRLEDIEAGQTVRVGDRSSLAITARPPLDAFEVDGSALPDAVASRPQEHPRLSLFWVPDGPVMGSVGMRISEHGPISRYQIGMFGGIDVAFEATRDFCGSGADCEAVGHLVKEFLVDRPRVPRCEVAVACEGSALVVVPDIPLTVSPRPRGVPPTGWGP